jgi:hypothetical protein
MPERFRPFPSFFMGGFECSTHRRPDGRRLDLIASTRHDTMAEEDYAALARHGIRGARDGARWHLIERVPGRYDWSPVLPLIRAAKKAGVRVAWDLCHYGHPDHVDPMRDGFADALARYADAFARLLLDEEGEPPILCPVNEMSFWSWAGGEVAYFNPGAWHRGGELKGRLVEASLAAGRAARAAVPGTRLIAVDPLINVLPKRPEDEDTARAYHETQWEAWDGLLGRWWPDLGGAGDGFDVMGVNYYWNNQWEREGDAGKTVRMGEPLHRPFRDILLDAHARFGKPMIVAETSIEGTPRAPWLRYVATRSGPRCARARRSAASASTPSSPTSAGTMTAIARTGCSRWTCAAAAAPWTPRSPANSPARSPCSTRWTAASACRRSRMPAPPSRAAWDRSEAARLAAEAGRTAEAEPQRDAAER